MRKSLLAPIATALLLATTTAALAIDVTSTVRHVNVDERIILLANGDKVIVPEDFDISTLAPAIVVEVSYDNTGEGPYQATSISVVPPPAPQPAAGDGAANEPSAEEAAEDVEDARDSDAGEPGDPDAELDSEEAGG
ncbi:MAG: DUF1344 domain-containing protein [Bauldia sp.]|nr:DUF1344 domain-containing protein [Bauldia sp.]